MKRLITDPSVKWATCSDGHVVLFSPRDGVYRHLNQPAALLWVSITRRDPLRHVIHALSCLPEAPPSRQVKTDVAAVLRFLLAKGYLRLADE